MSLLDFLGKLGGGALGPMISTGTKLPGAMNAPVEPPPPQRAGLFEGLSSFNERNPGLFLALGDIVAGRDPGQSIAFGLQAKSNRKKANATRDYLMRTHGLSADDADAIIESGAAGQWLRPGKAGGDDVRYSLNPIYGTDENGNTVLGTIGEDGSFKAIDTGGFNVASGIEKVDLGTHYNLYDKRTGQLVGREEKQNYQEAFDTSAGGAAGKAKGEAQAAYESMMTKMPGLEQVVSQLDDLADKATYTLGGQMVDWGMKQAGMEPREAAVARAQYVAMVDNQILPLLRDTFGAQFTQKEGETLRATLGDPDKSPKEKQAVLKAFIEQKRRDVAALAAQAGFALQPGTPPQGGTRLRYNPATGELE